MDSGKKTKNTSRKSRSQVSGRQKKRKLNRMKVIRFFIIIASIGIIFSFSDFFLNLNYTKVLNVLVKDQAVGTNAEIDDVIVENNNENISNTDEKRKASSYIKIFSDFEAALVDFLNIRNEERKNQLQKLKQDIEAYLSDFNGRYGLYYINLETGDEFGINESEEYIAASTSKLPINMYLYKKISEGAVDPEQLLTYIKADFEPGAGTVQNSDYGTQYTVREASRLSVEISDNCAVNMIIRLLGIENIRKYMTDMGGSIYYGSRHRSCPKDMAVYARELYRLYLLKPEVYGELIGYMENTIYNDRINALLPEEVRVAHKIGNFTGTMNDVGIVFARQPYVLCVMSKDIISEAEACKAISNVSKMIYDFVAGT